MVEIIADLTEERAEALLDEIHSIHSSFRVLGSLGAERLMNGIWDLTGESAARSRFTTEWEEFLRTREPRPVHGENIERVERVAWERYHRGYFESFSFRVTTILKNIEARRKHGPDTNDHDSDV